MIKTRIYVKQPVKSRPAGYAINAQIESTLKHSIFFDTNTHHDQTGNSNVSLNGTTTLNADGLQLTTGSSSRANLGTTRIGGPLLTVAVWAKKYSGTNYNRLIDFGNSVFQNNSIAFSSWK